MDVFKDLMLQRTHKNCDCAACLYARYKESDNHKGRTFPPATFFVFWLIIQIRETFAKRASKLRPGDPNSLTIFWWKGILIFAADYRAFQRAPYRAILKKVLKSIVAKYPEYESAFYPDINTYLKYLMKDYIRRWEKNRRFLDIINHLRWKIREEATKEHLASTMPLVHLGIQIYGFLLNNKEANRTQLLRHFSNKRVADLESAIDVFNERRGESSKIVKRQEGRKTVYSYGSMPVI